MEQGGRADQIGTDLQRHTTNGLGLLEILDGGKMPIHQHGIGERLQMFRWLELGRVRRQEE
jgi:hypothetical protein